MKDLAGKKALIVGLGKSGTAAARFLAREGACVTVTDLKPPELLTAFVDRLKGLPIRLELGGHKTQSFLETDLLVLSPGVDRRNEPFASAIAAGILVTSEANLALQATGTPVIAVTGSAGKTTTCTLISRMLEAGGYKTYLGGNIGSPLVDYVMDGMPADFIVAELSSFQLELIDPFVPSAVVYTPIAQDHLDRYARMEDYVAAKQKLSDFCTRDSAVVVSFENSWHAQIAAETSGELFWYSTEEPQGMQGAYFNRRERRIEVLGRHLSLKKCVVGEKNAQNLMAAACIATRSGISTEAIQSVIDGFKGIAHRLEFVRAKEGVTYFNDSKATNVISVLNALNQFNDESVVLLLGGKNKAIDFSPLCESVKRKCKWVIAFGEAGPLLAETLGSFVSIVQADGIEQAVRAAAERAQKGDSVVLSPACASHDMFSNYEERGDRFKTLVGNL